MRKYMIASIILFLLVAAGGTAYLQFLQARVIAPTPPPMTPQAQVSRLTSHLLMRKLGSLKDRAIYLQHREEGKKLVKLGLGKTEEENTEEDVLESPQAE